MIKTVLFSLFIFCELLFGQEQSLALNINLKDFIVKFDSIWITPGYIMSTEFKGDTAFVSLEPGDSPEGQMFRINDPDVKILNVSQKYETSISIMDEGPHFDLLHWKHYISEWQVLKQTDNNAFKSVSYSEELHGKFPQTDIRRFKEYVKRTAGDRWHDLVINVKSVKEYPCTVDISRIIYKIKYSAGGQLKEKYLIFEMPLGC
jgi:hypothetical protein